MFHFVPWPKVFQWVIVTLPALVVFSIQRLKFYVLSRIAHQHIDRMTSLAICVSAPFSSASSLFSGVRWVIVPGMGYGISPDGTRDPICWEAPTCLSILLAGEQVFGLGVELRGAVLSVRQLQGVRGRSYPHNLKKWPQMLVLGCIKFAELEGFKEVRVYKADQGMFYEYPEIEAADQKEWQEKVAEHQRRMRRRYDGTARQLKFEEMEKYWRWVNPHYSQRRARPE